MPLLSTHIFKKICSFLIFLIYLHRCVEIWTFLLLLRVKPPQSLRDSSPKGAPFGAAANFPIMPNTLATSLRPWLSLRGKTSPAPGEDVTVGDKRGNLARERLRGSAVPLRADFPRSGGRCRVATKGGVWLDAKRQDGRGTHTKSTASLCGKRCFFQPFSARLWKTRCSFSSSYWWGP